MTKARAKSPFTAIETTSRSGLVEQQLRDFILNNKLVPGHKLPSESELSNDLGVSRTAIREGFKCLEAVGVINAHQGKGRFVGKFDSGAIADNLAISLTIDRPSLQDILEIRKALETGFLTQAASLLKEEDFAALERLVRRMNLKVKEPTTFLQEDMEFHRILFGKLNNRVLLNILEIFWKLFRQVEEGTEHTAEQLKEAVNQHKVIVAALRKGNVSRAKELLDVHFRDAERRIAASQTR
jgi:GntR family transcriptional repressor for pyruvate dehydrogenase complex